MGNTVDSVSDVISASPVTSISSVTETLSSTSVEIPLVHETCSEIEIIKTFYKKTGIITSPGYDGKNEYPRDSICDWVVKSEGNEVRYKILKKTHRDASHLCPSSSNCLFE